MQKLMSQRLLPRVIKNEEDFQILRSMLLSNKDTLITDVIHDTAATTDSVLIIRCGINILTGPTPEDTVIKEWNSL